MQIDHHSTELQKKKRVPFYETPCRYRKLPKKLFLTITPTLNKSNQSFG